MTVKIIDLTPHPKNNELPLLSADERTGLKRLIEIHGFTDPIEITKKNVILDGHNRVDVAKEIGLTELPFRIIDIPEEEELNYIIDKNSARRQMTPKTVAYLRGKLYLHLKGDGEGKKSTQIAQEDGVSEKTVRRDAKFAKDLEEATKHAPELKDKILSNDIKATKEDISKLADLPELQQKEVLKKAEDRGEITTALEELQGTHVKGEKTPNWAEEELRVSTNDKLRTAEGILIRKLKSLEKQKKVHAAFDVLINRLEKILSN